MKWLMVFVSLALCISCQPPEARQEESDNGNSAYRQRLTRTWSDDLGDSVYGGYKQVVENRQSPGRTINIFVMVIPATSDTVLSPLFHFDGGPGQPASSSAQLYMTGREFYRNRDVVIMDVRGTGQSNGLYCPSLQYDPNHPEQAFEESFAPERVRACLEELKDQADLTQYSTANVVEDAEEIRKWLGYDKINVIGYSYGTRVCEAYLRRYPASIRSAIMSGPAPEGMHRPESFAKDAQAAWELICRDCAASISCNEKYPNLAADLDRLLAKLQKNPVDYAFGNPPVKVKLTRGVMAEVIRTIMYTTDGQRKLPSMIHAAVNGNFGPLAERTLRRSMNYRSLSNAVFLCITCSEDTQFIDTLKVDSLTSRTFLGDYRIRNESRACSLWPRHTLPASASFQHAAGKPANYGEPVNTDVPVLIISGTHDPVTPPRWGEVMARGMTKATRITIDYMAHSSYGLSGDDCLPQTFSEFLKTPEAPVEMPCRSRMWPRAFQ